MKPLVACYKTYRGGEWFAASLESIRTNCIGIVAVTTGLPWLGHRGTENRQVAQLAENCRAPLQAFADRHPEIPVTDVRLPGRVNSEDQYRTGLAIIRTLYGPDCGVLIVDTDEIWEADALTTLRQAMSEDSQALYFRSGIWTYLRSPFYRVYPQEPARVVVGLAHPEVPIGESRFSGLEKVVGGNRTRDVACSYHHLGYVRLDPEEIIAKLSNTSSQDAVKCNPAWKQTVWDHLPRGKDLHPVTKVAHIWRGVEELPLDRLPSEVVHTNPFWACASHHRGGIPLGSLLDDSPKWRSLAETDQIGVTTTVPFEFAVPLCAALQGKLTQDQCIFLTPRLRMSLRETCQLAQHAKQVPARGRVLEIGSGMGGSMAVLGACTPRGTELIAVDPYLPYDEENLILNEATEVGTAEEFHQTLGGCRIASAVLFRVPSKQASESLYGLEGFDLILIDGNHSYLEVAYDLEVWWPMVKLGGTLLAHDFSGRFPGVVRAIREFEIKYNLRFNLPQASSLAWVRKP